MMSDEMRELLSAYVDGELRDSDAVRIEALCKRDPAIRKEVSDYRKLRARLRAWDEDEHAVDVPPGFTRRMVEQARAQQRAAERARDRVGLWLRPLPVAAAVLFAAGIGLVAAMAGGDTSVTIHKNGQPLAIKTVQPAGSLALADDAVAPFDALKLPKDDSAAFRTVMRQRLDSRIVNGEPMSDQAIARRDEDQALMNAFEAKRIRTVATERRTVAGGRRMASLMAPFEVVAAPLESLVLLKRPQIPASVFAAEANSKTLSGLDNDSESNLYVQSLDQRSVVVPAGTVWIAQDRSRRTRVVTMSSWIRDGQFQPMVWADQIEAPRGPGSHARAFAPQSVVLGPQARRELIGRNGKDNAARKWLEQKYGRKLSDVFRRDAARRGRIVKDMMRALERDTRANGFVVLDKKGKVLGAELFGTRDLMLELAPSLLHGYLIETNAISTRAPSGGVTVTTAIDLCDEIMGGCRIEEAPGGSTDWRADLRRINLMRGDKLRGHGLMLGDRPVHVTLFP